MGSDPSAPPELELLPIVDVSDIGDLLRVKTGDGVEAAASGLRVELECGEVAPGVLLEVRCHRPSAVVGVLRAVLLCESPVSPAVKACRCSGVEPLVATETEPATLSFEFNSVVSSAAAAETLQASGSVLKCSVVVLGSEVEVGFVVTGTETPKDLGENNPDVPHSKSRQTFTLRGNIVPKYLKAQKRSTLEFFWMKTNELLLILGVNCLYIEEEDNGVVNERVICEVSLVVL